ncbi:carboxylating nicotinate-nucleotide diphosphorylase [Helicobacter mustelae]|uniref:nicotinate-nucleotide diphosphorylase (carboxylating) n=1 Tax=Helicobacter mustelae (strain ATCC 43772 / CCUG 25715 / CIP 103759 / LMG 18044 / NCTC 12198 / R85-136P) TaxID=679897 RepID=D3UJ01_HELM1|nr:carboxylating nicotinate-nucleotide diphosphorylase [Helicobacter mustelae]CBG40476.1 nicotinate-nucleotide pyrophosphorylase [carboxylating] [Helicobacter mustelae 12198]SQH71975.1 nicotinate-nucleotide pyrophosphorylase [Helicobacter mustelae]STP13118.1 nicotinate-nucleotide pyrophosphorylase [Helicobacter mustelae]
MRMEEFLYAMMDEDIGRGDLFEHLVTQDIRAKAMIKAKSQGIFSGELYVRRLCELEGIAARFFKKDGDGFVHGDGLLELEGSYTLLLKLERCILNILQHSSGIATQTRGYVEILEGSGVELLDTRKTRPLLRVFEKYSVRNGGGKNHRLGLDDALMLKDTHLRYISHSSLKEWIENARKKIPWTSKIEIESESVEFAKIAMSAGVDIVMCDNMDRKSIKEVVAYRDANHAHVLLEASGDITKENLLEYAKTGVDAISSGALIHKAVWIDMSMKML